MSIYLRLAAALTLLGLLTPSSIFSPIGSVQAGPTTLETAPDLLVPPPAGAAAATDAAPRPGAPWVRRSRGMGLETRLLDGLQADQPLYAPMRLSLFPDATYFLLPDTVQKGAAGGWVLTGRLQDQPNSLAIVSWQQGILDGHLALPGSLKAAGSNTAPVFYQIHYDPATRLERVEQVDQAAFPQELQPLAPSASPLKAAPDAAAVTETGTRIDVQVYYDAAAQSAAGGQAAMKNLINTAIAETNVGFANSQVNDRFNLVYSALTNYDETGFDWTTTLEQLTSPNDGFMDEVHTTRNTYGADLTVLLVNDGAACGLSWVMSSLSTSFESNAFSVVDWACATGYYSFGHETGHLMGSVHDRANASFPGVFPYSYGYQDPGGAFRTIMAYNCPGGCPRIDFWSNPGIQDQSRAAGVDPNNPSASADNALSLNNTLSTVINFRAAPAPRAPTGLSYALNPGPLVQLNWTDASFNEDGFTIERSAAGANAFTQIGSAGMNAVQFTDNRPNACGDVDYRVRAFNSDGTSGYTNTVTVALPPCTVPAQPDGLSAMPYSISAIRLAWNICATGYSYSVERSPDGDTGWTQVAKNLPAIQPNYVDSGLARDTTYFYRIRCSNPAGTSAPSLAASAKTFSVGVYLPLVRR